jgi:hypothetical protein
MAGKTLDDNALRATRDRLVCALAELDRLGERAAAIEINSAIEILNDRLGDAPDPGAAANLERRYFRS